MLAVVLVACGDVTLSTRELPQQVQGNFLAEVVPPTNYYRQQLIRRFHNIDRPENNSRQFFINFHGEDIEQGVDDRQSFLVCRNQTTVPASRFDNAAQLVVVDAVADFFANHQLNNSPQIVSDRPQQTEYSTVHVGGNHHQVLGCHDKKNVLGHAPTDEGDINPIDVGFVFDWHGDGDLLIRAIAHVIGRMSGLSANRRNDGVMSLTMSAVTPLRFGSQTLTTRQHKGSSSTGSHFAGHNFLVTLASKLAETDDEDDDLQLSLFVEKLRWGMPKSVETPGLERVLAVLLPKKDKSNKISFKGILGQIVRKTVAKKFGNTSASILDAVLSRKGKGKTQSRDLLDFSQLLELDRIDRPANLFPLLEQQLTLTDKIATADDRQSLHSVLKVGYFQRLTEISH